MILNLSHLRTIPCGLSSSPQKVHCFTEEPPLLPLSKHHWSFIQFETGLCVDHDEFTVMTQRQWPFMQTKHVLWQGPFVLVFLLVPTSTGRVSIWCINVLKLSETWHRRQVELLTPQEQISYEHGIPSQTGLLSWFMSILWLVKYWYIQSPRMETQQKIPWDVESCRL